MYLLIIHYSKPVSDVAKHREAHRDWIKKYVEEGVLLLAGPNKSETGGVILAKSIDKDRLRKIIAEDAYVKADVADYQIIDFVCNLASAELENLKSV